MTKPIARDVPRAAPLRPSSPAPVVEPTLQPPPPSTSTPADGYKTGPTAPPPATSATVASTEPVSLSPEQSEAVVKLKATCPFIGSAVAQAALPVRNSPDQPLGSIDDVTRLGNSGGGSLGKVLALFAQGNHAKMVGPDGKLSREVPPGTFSLDFPGSQGSHPGHSGILQGNPLALNSGRFSGEDLDRLLARAKDGHVKRSDVARFIAENLVRDPSAKVFDARTAKLLGLDTLSLVGSLGPAIVEAMHNLFRADDTHDAHRDVLEHLTRLLGEDNLVGSAGEFALLFAFLRHKPGAKELDGEPALAVEDLTLMFKDKKLPEGWETWPKNAGDWLGSTLALTREASYEYHRLAKEKAIP
mgnify:CR=1 FL=1